MAIRISSISENIWAKPSKKSPRRMVVHWIPVEGEGEEVERLKEEAPYAVDAEDDYPYTFTLPKHSLRRCRTKKEELEIVKPEEKESKDTGNSMWKTATTKKLARNAYVRILIPVQRETISSTFHTPKVVAETTDIEDDHPFRFDFGDYKEKSIKEVYEIDK
ncbi:hypothetical protein BDZ45DRAFT_809505 [Acephala macrosclerotiorum]|nr:hypothetical protein BDZ45DRAFT_809505 [Acephala macrosclerotiorum]